MGDGLMDLGGGIKMVDPSALTKPASGGGLAETLQIMSMQSQLANAPLQKAKLENEVSLQNNELLNLKVTNELQAQQLRSAIGQEWRDQAKFQLDALKQLPELFQVDFSVGQRAVQMVIPNSEAVQNEDGTVSISYPSQKVGADGTQSRESARFIINPNQVTPEQKRTLEKEWEAKISNNEDVKEFAEVSKAYQSFKDSSSLGTGQGDQNMLYQYIKMVNPSTTLKPGQQATLENMGNLFNNLGNLWNKMFTESAPIFGAIDSKERKNFKDAADILYKNSRSSAVAIGQHAADFAHSQGLNPMAILKPVGDITVKDFMMTDRAITDLANKRAAEAAKAAAGGTP